MHTHIVSPTMLHACCGESHIHGVVAIPGRGAWKVRRKRDSKIELVKVSKGEHLNAIAFIVNEFKKHHKVNVLFIGSKKVKDFTIMEALYRDKILKRPRELKHKDQSVDHGEKKVYRKKRDYNLGDTIEFGKYGPEGENLPIMDIINFAPGYIRWCLETFGEDFLTPEALRYYNEKRTNSF